LGKFSQGEKRARKGTGFLEGKKEGLRKIYPKEKGKQQKGRKKGQGEV